MAHIVLTYRVVACIASLQPTGTITAERYGHKDSDGQPSHMGRKYTGHHYIGHHFIGHRDKGRNCIAHNYICQNYIGHNYVITLQPTGTMTAERYGDKDCDGHPGVGTILVKYTFPSGLQVEPYYLGVADGMSIAQVWTGRYSN